MRTNAARREDQGTHGVPEDLYAAQDSSGLGPFLQSGWYHQHTTTRTATTEDAKEVGIGLNTFDGIGP